MSSLSANCQARITQRPESGQTPMATLAPARKCRCQEAPFDAVLDGPQTALGIAAQQAGRVQLAEPDGVDLHDRWGDQLIVTRRQVLQLMQPFAQRPQSQRSELAVLQFALHGAQAVAHLAPALDLRIDLVAETLIGAQQPREVQLDAAAALTDDPRQA